MPSTTFFNLPGEKREKLLACARAEFARVPYPHASINQIIRAAGIPRGSFYMYFRDKDELFSYLIREFTLKIEALLKNLLAEHVGDPFTALPALYDFAMATARAPELRAAYEDLLAIMDQNGPSILSAFVEQAAPSVTAVFRGGVDPGGLDLRGEEDLDCCLMVLMPLAATAVRDGLLSADPTAIRRRFVNTLDILARGMSLAQSKQVKEH